MKPNTILGIVVAVFIAAVVGFFVFMVDEEPEPAPLPSPPPASVNGDTSPTGGQYIDYTPEALAASNSQNVLFFHAVWCPTCRSLDQNLNAGTIPEDITIYKVDYDTETALRQKYGVTFQHTLVQVDSQGNEIKKFVGAFDIEEIQEELVQGG